MDIIVNSLYSKKEIFLRELISNASDALDKIRFLALSEPDALGEGDQAKLEIRISFDRANKVLRLRDTGVGMTKDDLVNNLGTIAKSGTSSFLEAMQKGGDVNLIGQFGVGFYSVYLVADDVTVTSKNNADDQWVWSSRADGSFTIARDEAGNTLGRGTQIDIHLKDEAAAYLEQDEIEGLVMQYSEFINFPIYLEKENEVEREVVDETAEAEAAAQRAAAEAERRKAEEDGVVGEEEAEEGEGAGVEDEEAKPKMKIVKEIEREWEVLNLAKPIWTRAPAEVSEEDHAKFYEAVSRNAQPAMGMGMMMGPQPHMAHTHFKAEGDVEFKALLYVPSAPAGNFYEAGKRPRGLKLYVRRVFISDDFEELLPNYLGWVVGVVDSDTLPLSVSRETVQQSASLKTIRKKLVRKTIDMIKKLADKEAAEEETKEEEKEKKEEEERQLEIGDLVADMYEDEQWDIVEDDVVDAEQTMGSAAADHHESALGPVSDFKDTIFQWEYFLVLHPHATVLPRHPKNDKVRLTVHLENLCAYYGLSEAQKSHIALICGPRYTPKTDTVLLTTQTHESRIDNQKYLMKVVKDLVDEAKRFIPQES